MQFHGRPSWIRCFAHVIALICGSVLKDRKSGTAKDAQKALDQWEKDKGNSNYNIPGDDSRSVVSKIRFLNLWMLRSSQREESWAEMEKCKKRKPIYDVDSRWNSMYDMICQFLDLQPEYLQFISDNAQIEALRPTDSEITQLTSLAIALEPFKKMTLQVSQSMPTISRSLEKYWELDELIRNVVEGKDKFIILDNSVKKAFSAARATYTTYRKECDTNSMLYAAHILDPRYRLSLILIETSDDQLEDVLSRTKAFFAAEWPTTTATRDASPALSSSSVSSDSESRPSGISSAVWRQIQARTRTREAELAIPISEYERWIQSPPLECDLDTYKDPDFLLNWWRDHQREWPALALAARYLLACSASEVDVERLFSTCRDEYGLRRHALKTDTVRVLTLLRSAYQSEDDIDARLVAKAMSMDLDLNNGGYSVLFRPDDRIDGNVEGKQFLNTL
jgi:hypothetical protein